MPSSIQSLPHELLREVFLHYLALDDSPWRLACVCEQWQHIALNTSRLWINIAVTNDMLSGDVEWRVPTSRQIKYSRQQATVCRDLHELRDAMHMAGVLPVSMEIYLKSGPTRSSVLMALLNEVFRTTTSDRIGDLYVEQYAATLGQIMLESKLDPLLEPFGSFINLRILHGRYLPVWMDHCFQAICASTATSLVHLTVPRATKSQHMDVLAPNLIRLERLECLSAWPLQESPELVLPRLKELICLSNYVERLHLPRLESLTLENLHWGQPNQASQTQEFPELTMLHLTMSTPGWLRALNSPKLQTLYLVYCDTETTASNPLFTPRLFPTVECFKLSLPSEGDPQDYRIISCLEAVPNATSVEIPGWSHTFHNPILRQPLVRRLAFIGKLRLCSELQNLRLTIPDESKCTTLQPSNIELLQSVVNARKQSGQELRNFVVEGRDETASMIEKRFV